MKIIDIKNVGNLSLCRNKTKYETYSEIVVSDLELTVSEWFGLVEKKIKVFSTNRASVIKHSGEIEYVIFCDSVGNVLSEDNLIQINNWCRINLKQE